MYVKRYKLHNQSYHYLDTVIIESSTKNLRWIYNSQINGKLIQYHIVGIHDQAKYIGFSNKYKKIKL